MKLILAILWLLLVATLAGAQMPPTLDKAYLERIVAEELAFTPAQDSAALARLRSTCAKLAETGALAGTQVMTFDDVMKFYCNPGRGVYAASLCLPLTDDAARAKLQPIIRTALLTCASEEGLAKSMDGEISGGPATPQHYRFSRNNAAVWDAALAAQAYGQATGDWETVKSVWPSLRKSIAAIRKTEQSLYWKNMESRQPANTLEAAGCIAAIRLANRLGETGLSEGLYVRLEQAAKAMLAEVDDAAKRSIPELTKLGDGRLNLMYFGYLQFSTPETCRILKDQRPTEAAKILNAFEERHPWWHLNSFNHGMEGSGEEGIFQPPWVAFQVYQGKSMVCAAPAADLARRFPWPNVWATMRGCQDPYYLQILWTQAAIEANATWKAAK